MRLFLLLPAAAMLCAAGSAAIRGFIDPSAIDRAVADFTGAVIGAPGGARLPVDRRLKLAACDMPLTLEWHGRTRDSVLVRCEAPGGWRLFVPVANSSVAEKTPNAVARGDAVAIAFNGRGFSLSRQGEAMESGVVGDWIRVRPAGSKRDVIRARILRPGTVGMNLP